MNFVSQTLLARGWAPTEDWFNLAQEDWAPAFVHVPSFDEWLSSHPSTEPSAGGSAGSTT